MASSKYGLFIKEITTIKMINFNNRRQAMATENRNRIFKHESYIGHTQKPQK